MLTSRCLGLLNVNYCWINYMWGGGGGGGGLCMFYSFVQFFHFHQYVQCGILNVRFIFLCNWV